MNKKAFTLVELLVVITIVSILSVISFVSFAWYVSSSRDATRATDVKLIEKSLWVHFVQSSKYIAPAESITLQSGTMLLSKQWELDKKSLEIIWIHWGSVDPLTNKPYKYTTNSVWDKYQLLSLYENKQAGILGSVYAEEEYFPKLQWYKVWFAYESDKPFEKPSWNIDIFNSSGSLDIFIDTDNIKYNVSWSWIVKQFAPVLWHLRSCKSMYDLLSIRQNWIYTTVTEDGDIQEEYCEMTVKWGGWNLIASAPADSVDFWNRYSDGIWKSPRYNFTTPNWYEDVEYLSKSYESLKTNEIMLCQEWNAMCFIFPHEKNIPLYHFYRDDISYRMMSYNLAKYPDSWSRNLVTTFLDTYGAIHTETPAECWAIGINISSQPWFTTHIMWYGWDFDEPCVAPYWPWMVDGRIDNLWLGLWIYFWNTWYNRTSGYVTVPDLAWYQKFNILWKYTDIWSDIKPGPVVYMSDTWYVLWR
jgi:prepilin-type N-terminal cleavage/methylation domain-containing protein